MKQAKFTLRKIEKFQMSLYEEERSQATIEKYIRDVKAFYKFLPEEKDITKEQLMKYKKKLIDDGYKITSINSMIVAINRFLQFMNLSKYKLKLCTIQKKVFYDTDKELTKEEYKCLLNVALQHKNLKLYMLIQTICSTGIRVSEHQFITVESTKEGKAVIYNKGKVRTIFITKELRLILLDYCKKSNIKSGPIFVTKGGKPIDRSNIWTSMKKLCKEANIDEKKVYPHNLRHLFALTYYRIRKEIVRLADILGHSSVDTTRIYTMTNNLECIKTLSKMDLVVGQNYKTT